MKKRILQIGLAMMIAACGLVFAQQTLAAGPGHGKDKGADYVQVVGDIEAFDETQVTISGTVMLISDTTRLRGTLEVGARARAVGIEDADSGDITARYIAVQRSNDKDDYVRISGAIDAISETQVTISGTLLLLTDDTRISGELVVGESAKAYAVEDGDSLVAVKIRVVRERPTYVKVRGPITAIGDASVTISDTVMTITDSTKIRGELVVSATARAFAWEVDGELIARYISVRAVKEVTGTLETLSPDSATIAGVRYQLDADTFIGDDVSEATMVVVGISAESRATDTALYITTGDADRVPTAVGLLTQTASSWAAPLIAALALLLTTTGFVLRKQ